MTIKEFYKKHDFDILYEECQNDRIPFNLYEEWIMNKFKINGCREQFRNDYTENERTIISKKSI